MTVANELINSLLADYKKPEDLTGENGLLKLLTKKLVSSGSYATLTRFHRSGIVGAFRVVGFEPSITYSDVPRPDKTTRF